jgi:hypothetical protein
MEAENSLSSKIKIKFMTVNIFLLAVVLMLISYSKITAAYGSPSFALTKNPCILSSRKVDFSPLRRLSVPNKRTESRPLLGLRHVSARLRDEELDAVAIDIITAVSAACDCDRTIDC